MVSKGTQDSNVNVLYDPTAVPPYKKQIALSWPVDEAYSDFRMFGDKVTIPGILNPTEVKK